MKRLCNPRTLLLLMALHLVAILTPLSAQDPVPKDLQKLINRSIGRGVDYLKKNAVEQQLRTAYGQEYPLGIRALCAYALLESEVPATDPVISQLFEGMQRLRLKWQRRQRRRLN